MRRSRLASPRLLAVIAATDVVVAARGWPRPVIGLLDESAHLATGTILLRAIEPDPSPELAAGLLAGSVLLDLDHVPELIGLRWLRHRGARPYPHSAATPLALALLAREGSRPRRDTLRGLVLGVCGHLARDLATPMRGGGVPLLWPLSRRSLRVPYLIYLLALAALTLRASPPGPYKGADFARTDVPGWAGGDTVPAA